MKIKQDFSLKKLNTFGVEVKAKLFAEVFSEEELKEILLAPELNKEQKLILGGGSNILFSKDYDGLVIKMSITGIKIKEEDETSVYVEAGAGVIWNDLVLFSIKNNFGGIENLSLIPGTVGAAPVQNIGAYGQELKNVLFDLKGFYKNNAVAAHFNKEECSFGYRSSIFKKELKDKFIITSVTLKLSKNPIPNFEYRPVKTEIEKQRLKEVTIKDVSEIICNIRKNKLPDPKEIGNAGSFFKNPEITNSKFEQLKKNFPDLVGYNVSDDKIKIPAGWLIEKAGLKGIREGNTGTHQKQALVIVNYGSAAGSEIKEFASTIKEKIYNDFGIELEEEVNIV